VRAFQAQSQHPSNTTRLWYGADRALHFAQNPIFDDRLTFVGLEYVLGVSVGDVCDQREDTITSCRLSQSFGADLPENIKT